MGSYVKSMMAASKQPRQSALDFMTIRTLYVKDFNLKHTLECGQLFRQIHKDGWHYVHTRDRLFKVRQAACDRVQYAGNADDDFLIHFFRLDDDLSQILGAIEKDQHMAAAIQHGRGLRLIRQDGWECLISYICSQFSNIPKIRKNVEWLSSAFGKPVHLGDYVSHTFPDPGTLDDFEQIRAARTGYRAKYLYAANRSIRRDDLRRIARMSYPDAKRTLMSLQGVGHKVADCVLLFGLDFPDAFPVDVWVKKAMQTCYFGGLEKSCTELRQFGQEYFGRYAGYAQQYLFYYWRTTRLP